MSKAFVPTFYQIDVFCIRTKSFTFNLKVTDPNITNEDDISTYCENNNLFKGRGDVDEIHMNELTEDEYNRSVGKKKVTALNKFGGLNK